VELLLKQEQVVGELVRKLPIAQSGVSRHLRILKDAGMVESRTEGQRRIYSLRAEPFEKLSEWLGQYRRLWEDRLDQFEVELARQAGEDSPEVRHRTPSTQKKPKSRRT